MLAQSAARHLRIPGIVLLLFAGVSLGPDGLGWVVPDSLGPGLIAIVDLAVAIILFEGGLNLEITRLRREQAAIRRLVTWGALVTLLGGTLAARIWLDWDWRAALLFGGLVVVTGPTVIGPLVDQLRLKTRVSTVLEAEGVLIDPIGAILAVLVLELVLARDPNSMLAGGQNLLVRLGFGASMGVAGGLALAGLLRIRRLVPEGHENIFVLASVLLLFAGCEEVESTSGVLAVTIAGVVVGNLRSHVDRDLREFKDQLTVLLIGLLFVMLAADVRISQVQALGWGGALVMASLIFVVRPLGVLLSTIGSELTWRERTFVAWIAPRGIVAAAIASIVAVALEGAGFPGGKDLRALVFLTIASTVVLAGLTAAPVGRLLGVRLPGRDGVAILGAQSLGIALAQALKSAGIPVVFIDSNPQHCRRAEEAGFSVVFGNAVAERTLHRARMATVKTSIALTPNQTLNSVFVARARELFEVREGLVAAARADQGLVAEWVASGRGDVVFDGAHDVERWDVRWRHGDVETERRRFSPPPEQKPEPEVDPESSEPDKAEPKSPAEPPSAGERLVLLAVERAGKVFPMRRSLSPKAGDIVWVAIHKPDRLEADQVLEAWGWGELVEDDPKQETADEEGEIAVEPA